MNRFRILVYAPESNDRSRLKNTLVRYAVSTGTEILIDWVKPGVSEQELYSSCREKDLAFVYADDEAGISIGSVIYAESPSCMLVYFGVCRQTEPKEAIRFFKSLFPSRPIRYSEDLAPLEIEEILSDRLLSFEKDLVFVRETKGIVYRFPYHEIEYFKSDRNYIYVVTRNKQSYPFLAKLSQIETSLERGCFIRVHQSFLVNKRYIQIINKKKKSIVLKSGEEIYVSRSHYKELFG